MICSSDSEDDDDETIPDAPTRSNQPNGIKPGGGAGSSLAVPNGSTLR